MIEPKKLFHFRKEIVTSEKSVFEWSVPGDSPYFEGHFPDNPLLPAIAMLDGSLEAVRLTLESEDPPYVKTVHSAKFTAVICPGSVVKLHISQFEKKWTVLWTKDGTQTAEFSFTTS